MPETLTLWSQNPSWIKSGFPSNLLVSSETTFLILALILLTSTCRSPQAEVVRWHGHLGQQVISFFMVTESSWLSRRSIYWEEIPGCNFFTMKSETVLSFWTSVWTQEPTYILTYLLTYLLTPWSRVLLEKLTSKLVKKFPAFMEPESPSPYPQVPATCPYPEPIPVPTTSFNFMKIHLNIILLSTSWSPQWTLFLRLPHQHPVHTSVLSHTRHMPCPSHSFRFYHPHSIG